MNAIEKQIERDCVKQMLPCFALHFLVDLLTLVLPVVTSWMIGGMADALLTLDLERIRARLAIFLAAFVMDVLVLKAAGLWENLELTLRGFQYGHQMFSRYLHLPMRDACTIDAAALVQRLDMGTTEYYFLLMVKWTHPAVLGLYLAVLGTMFASEALHPLFILAMASLAAVPVLRAAYSARQKALLHQAKLDYEELRKRMELGLFSARDFLRGFGLPGRYIGRVHRQFDAYVKTTAAAQDRRDAWDDVFSYLCVYGVPLGVIAAGALLVAGGRMGVGALLAGYLIVPTLTKFYGFVEELLISLRQEPVLRDRLKIFYAGRDKDGGAAAVRELRLDRVAFSYPGGEGPVFREKSLTVPLTGRVHITGPNGAGKSTLLSLLAGVWAPESGAVVAEDGRRLDCGTLRRAVALLEQDGGLFAATAAENLFLPPEKLPEAERLLRALGFEKPLDTMLEECGQNLSPGERKKLLLARALLKDAAVLALDEPMNHLDAAGAAALAALLAAETRPILLASHTPPTGIDWRRLEL